MKYMVDSPEEVTWFENRINDYVWAKETECVKDALLKLESADKLSEFFLEHASWNDEVSDHVVDMDSAWKELRLEPDSVLKRYGLKGE